MDLGTKVKKIKQRYQKPELIAHRDTIILEPGMLYLPFYGVERSDDPDAYETIPGTWIPKKIIGRAPLFDVTKREHSFNMPPFNYHAHVLMRRGGGYERSGHIITCLDDSFFLQEHGREGNPLIAADKMYRGLLREAGYKLPDLFKGVPEEYIMRPGQDAIFLGRTADLRKD